MPVLPGLLVELGTALSLTGSGFVYQFSGCGLYTYQGREIWIFQPSIFKHRAAVVSKQAKKKVGRIWSEFTGLQGELDCMSVQVPEIALKYNVGEAVAIKYRSTTTDGRNRLYLHNFETDTKIWINRKKSPSIFAVIGNRIKIGVNGIEG